jgi:hypothetical protein
MNWRPTLKQLEIVAEMASARATPAVMAAAVGLSPDSFHEWRMGCLRATRAEEERYAKPEPIPEPKPVAVAASPRIVAARLFESPEAEAAELSGA